MRVRVHCNGQDVKIKEVVLIRMYGRIVDVIPPRDLAWCLALQAIYRSLERKRATTDGYKPEELRVLATH